jgi:hypothetical protein
VPALRRAWVRVVAVGDEVIFIPPPPPAYFIRDCSYEKMLVQNTQGGVSTGRPKGAPGVDELGARLRAAGVTSDFAIRYFLLSGPAHHAVVLRSVVLRSVVLRSVVLRSVVLRSVVLRSVVLRCHFCVQLNLGLHAPNNPF